MRSKYNFDPELAVQIAALPPSEERRLEEAHMNYKLLRQDVIEELDLVPNRGRGLKTDGAESLHLIGKQYVEQVQLRPGGNGRPFLRRTPTP
jgi:hypothetical protein